MSFRRNVGFKDHAMTLAVRMRPLGATVSIPSQSVCVLRHKTGQWDRLSPNISGLYVSIASGLLHVYLDITVIRITSRRGMGKAKQRYCIGCRRAREIKVHLYLSGFLVKSDIFFEMVYCEISRLN
jgi:hypothetical protein